MDAATPIGFRANWDIETNWDYAHSVTLTQYISPGRVLKKTYTSAPASSFYDDPATTRYYDSTIPWDSVKTAGSGLRLDITGVSSDRTSYRVHLH